MKRRAFRLPLAIFLQSTFMLILYWNSPNDSAVQRWMILGFLMAAAFGSIIYVLYTYQRKKVG